MGNQLSDNQEVEHESGASRMCSSFCLALCGFPTLLIAMIFVLGWNEKRAVCDAKAIAQGKREVKEVDCTTATEGDGKLVMFGCDMTQDGLQPFSLPGGWSQSLANYLGTGLKIQSEMYQCVERVESKTTKDDVGGGKTTIKTYYYSQQWKSDRIDSYNFKKKDSNEYRYNCQGRENPQWPTDTPKTQTLLAPVVQVGAFKIEKAHIEEIPLPQPVGEVGNLPPGWNGGPLFYRYRGSNPQIGDMRIRFHGTDWAKPAVTVLGENNGGTIKKWTAADTWLCSGYTLSDLKPGSMDKDTMFKALEEDAQALTWILRLVGFALGWVAFCLLAGPLEVAADCIPCIGPCLGDSLTCIASIVSCLPATACCLGVIGVVWVVMRPMVGGALLAIFLCIFCSLLGYKCYAQQTGMGKGDGGPGPEMVGNSE